MQIAQALRVMVFDASAADLAAAEREPVYEHGAPAVLRGGGVDLLAPQPGGSARVGQRQLLAVHALCAVGHEKRMGRLEPLFQHAARQHTAAHDAQLRGVQRLAARRGQQQPLPAPASGREASAGKDTTIGHWEIAGLLSPEPLPTFPNGFPKEVLDEFTARTGYQVLCNKPYSGTEVIKDYGEEHMKTGALIVYTSADSVFQIAANEAIVPVEKLYEICAEARRMLVGKYGVGRVIARPFVGDCAANFTRTPRRHDFSLVPPADTMLDVFAAGW